MLHRYKAIYPTRDRRAIEFRSKHYLSDLDTYYINGAVWVWFDDAEVFLNLSCLSHIEIDGKRYKVAHIYNPHLN